ncbi:hypothetical protein [Hydrotalea sp.]|uniref:hypothetical protein n=1 Tax=Hydrotalea sp. TaxID=2881279 RepID=UPI0026321457|nr:hypothetical protein [Hydrotalea sp.]
MGLWAISYPTYPFFSPGCTLIVRTALRATASIPQPISGRWVMMQKKIATHPLNMYLVMCGNKLLVIATAAN